MEFIELFVKEKKYCNDFCHTVQVDKVWLISMQAFEVN